MSAERSGMSTTTRAPMTGAERRREAKRIIAEALEGGISFMFDDQGRLMRWVAMPDFDPTPRKTWDGICVDFNRFLREIKTGLRRRLSHNGKILMGTPVLEASGEQTITKDAVEWAWANRDEWK